MPRKKRDLPWCESIGGVYYIHWYDAAKRRTQRLSLRTSDAREAQNRFAEFLTQGEDIYRPADEAALTCDAALDYYLKEHVRGGQVVDVVRTENRVKNLRRHFGPLPVAGVDIPDCRAYAEKRRTGLCGRPGNDGTIRGELATLHAAMAHCLKWKHFAGPVPFIEKTPASAPRERWLTHDELALLLATCVDDTRVWGFVQLAYFTASRRAALEGLTWFQWNDATDRINLAPPERRQTRKRRPVVPVDPELKRARTRLWQSFGGTGYVLGSQRPIYAEFVAVCQRAGLKNVTPHTLRHTRATHLLQAGKSIWTVAQLLGDTVATVEKNYGHHCVDHLADAIGNKESNGA